LLVYLSRSKEQLVFDDLGELFHHGVLATYQEYEIARQHHAAGRSQHLRAAIDVATQLFHLREHLPTGHACSRKVVTAACPDYRLLADVVNAAKHGSLDRPTSDGPPLVKSAEDIRELTVVTRYRDDSGEYSDAATWIKVRCTDGTERNFDVAITNVLNYWGAKLQRLGVLKQFRSFPLPSEPGSSFVPRAAARNMNLELVRGVRFSPTFQLQQFDPDAGRSFPIDLSGSEIVMTFRKPPRVIFSVRASRPGHDDVVCDIDLSEEESIEYSLLQLPTELETFRAKMVEKYRDRLLQNLASIAST
jgi:hypothetical protein